MTSLNRASKSKTTILKGLVLMWGITKTPPEAGGLSLQVFQNQVEEKVN